MGKTTPKDTNETAADAVEKVTGLERPTGVYDALLKRQSEKNKDKTEKKNAAAVALGRLGGLKGGNARAASLSPLERKEIARKGAQKRWENAAKRNQEILTEEMEFLALKRAGMTLEEIQTRMRKSHAELSNMVYRLIDAAAKKQSPDRV